MNTRGGGGGNGLKNLGRCRNCNCLRGRGLVDKNLAKFYVNGRFGNVRTNDRV